MSSPVGLPKGRPLNGTPDLMVRGCTAVIQSRRWSGKNLAWAFNAAASVTEESANTTVPSRITTKRSGPIHNTPLHSAIAKIYFETARAAPACGRFPFASDQEQTP